MYKQVKGSVGKESVSCCAYCLAVTNQKSCAVELSYCGICALYFEASTADCWAADAQEVKESRAS